MEVAPVEHPSGADAAVADPATGAWVLQNGNWYIVGGTSVATPVVAGIRNLSGSFSLFSAVELTKTYGNPAGFTNIGNGDCGPNEGYLAGAGWNFCTGNGTPRGTAYK